MEGAEIKARYARPKKQNPSAVKSTITSAVKSTTKPEFHSGKSGTTVMVDNAELLSRSSLGNALKQWSTPTLTEEYLAVEPEATRPKRVSARLTAKQYRDLSGRLN
jgi:hypothetical protein